MTELPQHTPAGTGTPSVPGHWEWIGEGWETSHKHTIMAAITGRRPEEIAPFRTTPSMCWRQGHCCGVEYHGSRLDPPDPDEWVVCIDHGNDDASVVAVWILDGPLPAEIVQRRVREARTSYIANLRRILEAA